MNSVSIVTRASRGIGRSAVLGVAFNCFCRKLLCGRSKVLNGLVMGVVAALTALWYERLRARGLLEKRMIASEMNHHVRNALQVVTYAAWAHEDEHLAAQLRDAVERIDWALREVLPGNEVGLTKVDNRTFDNRTFKMAQISRGA